MEVLIEDLNEEHLLKYLGFWAIKNESVTSKTSLIKVCRSIKHFILFLQDAFKPFLKDDMKIVQKILNSKDFFIECLLDFKELDNQQKNRTNYQAKFKEWSHKYLHWYTWDKQMENIKNSKFKP